MKCFSLCRLYQTLCFHFVEYIKHARVSSAKLQRWQDFVFSVKLHLGLIPWPISLIPNPYSISLSTVPLKKFKWGLFLSLWLWLWLLLLLLLSQVKVKSTPSPRPKTGVQQYISSLDYCLALKHTISYIFIFWFCG